MNNELQIFGNYSITMSELQQLISDNQPDDFHQLLDLLKMRFYDNITKRLEREELEYRQQRDLEEQKTVNGDN
jgi:hypothetical protein